MLTEIVWCLRLVSSVGFALSFVPCADTEPCVVVKTWVNHLSRGKASCDSFVAMERSQGLEGIDLLGAHTGN